MDLPCCYILLRVIGTIRFCVFEQEVYERFVDFRPKQWSGFLVNEGARLFEWLSGTSPESYLTWTSVQTKPCDQFS